MTKPAEIAGKRYNRLTALFPDEKRLGCYWFQCDCGRKKSIRKHHVTSGQQLSCGCYSPRRTHGGGGTPEYKSWHAMLTRCLNPKHKQFSDYGGRGITVCSEWQEGFANFLRDMGKRPSLRHTLDRVDNDGNYEPGNCRWATWKEQINNRPPRRHMTSITFEGRTMSQTEWAKELGVSRSVVSRRLKRMPLAVALRHGLYQRGRKACVVDPVKQEKPTS
jgi:hypothetical protein